MTKEVAYENYPSIAQWALNTISARESFGLSACVERCEAVITTRSEFQRWSLLHKLSITQLSALIQWPKSKWLFTWNKEQGLNIQSLTQSEVNCTLNGNMHLGLNWMLILSAGPRCGFKWLAQKENCLFPDRHRCHCTVTVPLLLRLLNVLRMTRGYHESVKLCQYQPHRNSGTRPARVNAKSKGLLFKSYTV